MDSSLDRIEIDGRVYDIEVVHRVQLSNQATRMIIPTFLTNDIAREATRVCVESIRRHTPEPHEIWIVDNDSGRSYREWLLQMDGVNLVLNHTRPINPLRRFSGLSRLKQILGIYHRRDQLRDGSYANAVALELGTRCIDHSCKTVFVMHNDTLVTKATWLKYLRSKLTGEVRAAAFLSDNVRVHALHVAGLLLDFTLFETLHMSFLPNIYQERYHDLPEYDVGDQITLNLKQHGFGVYVSPNTHNDPQLAECIDASSPFSSLSCVRCFDDDGNVVYLHMGRGTPKAEGTYLHVPGRTYPQQWVDFAEKFVLSGAGSQEPLRA